MQMMLRVFIGVLQDIHPAPEILITCTAIFMLATRNWLPGIFALAIGTLWYFTWKVTREPHPKG